MATGYDNRQSTRQSFAFKPQQAVQIDTRSQQSSVNVGVRSNGQNTGGVVMSQNPVSGGNAGANLPAFLDQLFEPYVQEQSRKRMIEGATAFMNGKTMEQIAEERPWLSNIFGPTDYQQGAATSAMLTQVQRWKQSTLENMDEIKKLPEDQVAGYIYNSAQAFATGDSFTDSLMFQEVIKSTAEVIPVVATERYKWNQEVALTSQVGLWTSAAETYETVARRTAGLESPTDQDGAWLQNFEGSLMASFIKPEGMADETYRNGMTQFFRSQIISGNYHTAQVMKNSGFLETLPLEERNRLETFYETQQTKALMKASEPYLDDILELQFNVRDGRVSLDEMLVEVGKINTTIRRETGIETPFYDVSDVTEIGTSLINRIVTRNDQIRQRNEAAEDRAADREEAARLKAETEELDASEARTMVQAGTFNAARAAGVDESLMSRAQYALVFGDGDYSSIAKTMADSQWISPLVKSTLNTRLQSSLGGWSESYEAAYREYLTIRESGSGGNAAVAAIYGDNLTNLNRYHSLRTAGVSQERAYAESFGSATAPVAQLSRERRQVLNEGLDKVIADREGTFGLRRFTGQVRLTDGAKANILAVIEPRASQSMSAVPDLEGTAAAQQELGRALNSREVEILGALAWRNPHNVPDKTILQLTGRSAEEGGTMLRRLVEDRLAAQGIRGNVYNTNLMISRLPDENGMGRLFVSADKGDRRVEFIINTADIAAVGAREERARAERDADRDERANARRNVQRANIERSRRRMNMTREEVNERRRLYRQWVSEGRSVSFREGQRRMMHEEAFIRGEYNLGDTFSR